MIKTKKLVSAACVAVLASCIGGMVQVRSAAAQTSDAFVQEKKTIPVGEGEFRLVVKRGPVNVFTYRPKSFTPNSPIWVVIHGQKRDVAEHSAFDYYDTWAPLAEKAGALLLVPEFVEQSWPTSWQFQFGNVMTKSLKPVPPKWKSPPPNPPWPPGNPCAPYPPERGGGGPCCHSAP